MKLQLIIVLLILIQGGSSLAQISISGGWQKDTIVIGDEVGFILNIEADKDVQVLGVGAAFLDSIYSALASIKAQADTSQPLIPQIADFELLDLGLWEDSGEDHVFDQSELNWTLNESQNKILYQNTFTFRLWDPGEIIMLYPPVIYSQNGIQDQYSVSEQARIIVAPPGGVMPRDSMNIQEIKPIIEEPVKLSDYMIYFILLGLVLIGGLIYWWYSNYEKNKAAKQAAQITPPPVVPAHEIALDKLNTLKSQQLWQKGKIKEYQSQLTYIVREYLENRYGILALESTTAEIINQHIQGLLDGKDIASLQRILQVADLVKFAKAKPEDDIHESFMNEALIFVDKTKIIESPSADE